MKEKFFVDEEEVSVDKFKEELENAIEAEFDEEEFDNMLDDVYEKVELGGLTFYPSQILYNCDRTAYNIAYSEEKDRMFENFMYDLTHYEEVTVNATTFRIDYEDDEEDEDDYED